MKTSLKLIAAAALFAALVWMGYRLLDHNGEAPSTARPEDTGTAQQRATNVETTDAPTKAAAPEPENASPTRVDVGELTQGASGLQQGVHGTLVDPAGNAIPDADVFLLEGPGPDLLRAMMLAQRGITPPPVAHTLSDSFGRFSLGIRKPMPQKTYEVRALHDRFADAHIPNIRVTDSEWYDAGSITMPIGNVVYGQVTVAGSGGLPIQGATVFANVLENLGSASMTPGREQGVTTTTDAAGNYRFDNIKTALVNLAAVAPGFAKTQHFGKKVGPEKDNRFNFELPPGQSISGHVTDGEGNPLARAKVTATAISSKTPIAEEATTDRDGQFEILGLVTGPYRLVTFAAGFVRADIAPVQAGAVDQMIVLEKQSRATIRVTRKSGALVRSYQIALKKHFEGQDHLGNSPTNPAQFVTPRDLDSAGRFTMTGIDPGGYVFEVIADGAAKTYSEPFSVQTGIGDPVSIELVLMQGGRLRGAVTTLDGSPLRGVTVTTMPNYHDESPLTALLGSLMPARITKTTAFTNANGTFVLERLTPGTYQLKFTHPDYYAVNQKDFVVADSRTTEITTLTMRRGTRIFGTVECDGKPAPHVKVSVASIPTPGDPNAASPFSGDAITDAQGVYEIMKRMPPARYQAQAARQTLGNAMMQVLDFAATKREFELAQGQLEFRLDFTIPAKTTPRLGR